MGFFTFVHGKRMRWLLALALVATMLGGAFTPQVVEERAPEPVKIERLEREEEEIES